MQNLIIFEISYGNTKLAGQQQAADGHTRRRDIQWIFSISSLSIEEWLAVHTNMRRITAQTKTPN